MSAFDKVVNLTQDELCAMAAERFGPNPRRWAFKCPICGDVASADDFAAAGVADPTNHVGRECIGRSLGALNRVPSHTRGCDWCAYGLIGGPWRITLPNGKVLESFPLAPKPDS